ncbi:MAG TPA: penicillin-binding protein [Bryobacteraceae bacterium]|nr:penicillin-binding protein [Bryobacteraceae bacterium]
MDPLATKRVHVLVRVAFLWVALIAARLIQLQVIQHSKYAELARDQQQKHDEIKAPRGAILDRYGQRLAMSLPVESVVVDPLRVPDLSLAADVLSRILHLDQGDLLFKLQSSVAEGRGFLWVKRKISRDEAERLRRLGLEWIEFRTESQRYYPNRSLAAQVIGSVDFEENGNSGIEQSLNDQLAGQPGEMLVTQDVKKRGFASTLEQTALPGQDVRLTIDARIQSVAEQELAKMVKAHRAKTGTVVAMDPRSGDILAMANYPTFDPNEPPKHGEMAARENLAVSAPFEPGSVYKVITLSSALETTHLRPESMINCGNGSINLFGRVIHDHSRYAALSMADVLARSSNIGAINIGLQVGDKNLYSYIRRFGFGKKTGVPLPGESSGMVRPLRVWQKSSIGSVAMGHEIGVTALQLAQACSVIASGGFLMKPRLLMDAQKSQPVRVLRPETAITMRGMMEGVVLKPYGTGHKYAQLVGYTSAGKTGTAQIYDNHIHQYTHNYNASFMGFAPVTNPRIVVVVTINGTEGTVGYGGPTSAPVFREVAAAGLRVMDVPKDLPEMVPDDKAPADENDLSIADVGSSIPPPLVQAGDAVAADDRPVASAKSALDQRLFSNTNATSGRDLAGPRVPNFQGKTVRNVIEQAAALGIPVEFTGSGVARAQAPQPGAILPTGQRVRVQFSR